MPVTLNKTQLVAISKLDLKPMKHLERLDALAKALGYRNQSTLMTALNAVDASAEKQKRREEKVVSDFIAHVRSIPEDEMAEIMALVDPVVPLRNGRIVPNTEGRVIHASPAGSGKGGESWEQMAELNEMRKHALKDQKQSMETIHGQDTKILHKHIAGMFGGQDLFAGKHGVVAYSSDSTRPEDDLGGLALKHFRKQRGSTVRVAHLDSRDPAWTNVASKVIAESGMVFLKCEGGRREDVIRCALESGGHPGVQQWLVGVCVVHEWTGGATASTTLVTEEDIRKAMGRG